MENEDKGGDFLLCGSENGGVTRRSRPEDECPSLQQGRKRKSDLSRGLNKHCQ